VSSVFGGARAGGVLLHVTSLPSGCIDEEAYRFVDWLVEAGQSWWQLLPLHIPDSLGSPYASRTPANIESALKRIEPIVRKRRPPYPTAVCDLAVQIALAIEAGDFDVDYEHDNDPYRPLDSDPLHFREWLEWPRKKKPTHDAAKAAGQWVRDLGFSADPPSGKSVENWTREYRKVGGVARPPGRPRKSLNFPDF